MTGLRAGISGCGAAAVAAAARLRPGAGCALVAAHDDDPAALAAFAAATAIGTHAPAFDRLLATGVDFVVLAGPLPHRLAQVRAAAEQGVHVLALAPLAEDATTAAAMLAACDAAEVELGVASTELADPVIEQLRRMLAADCFGGLAAVQGLHGDDAALRRPDAMPAHPLVELLGPLVHLTTWVTGRPVVAVTAQTTRSLAHADDGAVATAVLRGDIGCTWTTTRLAVARSFGVCGTDGGFHLADDRLWLRSRVPFRGPAFDCPVAGRDLVLDRAELARAATASAAAWEPIDRFARWLDDYDDFPLLGEQAVADLRVVDAVRRAAASGTREAP